MFAPVAGMIDQVEFLSIVQSTEFETVTNNKKISYYNIPAAFDIETSSFYQYGEKKACMYIWQFGIENWVTYGRTWGEFVRFTKVLAKVLGLSDKKRLCVYIHNFAYEFQFMRKHFYWDKLFFLEERKPVYGLTSGIEFRCSLKLSGKSLAKVGDDLQKYKVKKLVGDLDYQLIHLPCTPLQSTELGYCENDIRVLLAYIQEKIESDGDITKIPLTNTGYVRNYCREACYSKYRKYREIMDELTIDSDEYSQLKRGFQGGFTHASARYSGKVMKEVGSFDFTSSYPTVMLAEKFPMSKAELVEVRDFSQLNYYLKTHCCLFDITFKGLAPKVGQDHPISISKCWNDKGAVIDNGRVVAANELTTTCTEQDFFTYSEFYSWDKMEVGTFRAYKKAYLPKPFVEAILDLYERKTKLKGVKGEEINYAISKGMLNSAYGMTVTDIVRDEITYSGDLFSKKKPDAEEAIEHYNKSKKRFLFYPWGVWVTAYARANLFSGILAFGRDYIYADTDSIKAVNIDKHRDYIERYNAEIKSKLEAAAEFHHIDPARFSPLNRKGVAKPIGVWDFEGTYRRFKTIGAKRYLVETEDGYELTVAGVNKHKARDYLVKTYSDPMDGLDGGLVVPAEYSGRLISTYVDEPCQGSIADYLGNQGEFSELSYIHMEPSEYELTLSSEYKAFINFLNGIKEDSW